MPRKAREGSGTGVFHVMMRGINHQNIFEDTEDYYQFINTLDRMRVVSTQLLFRSYSEQCVPLRH